MATKTAPKKRNIPKSYVTGGRGERVSLTLDKRRREQLRRMIEVFGGDNSSAISDCIARRHIELQKEYPDEFR